MNQLLHELLTWVRSHAPQARLVADSRHIQAGDVFIAYPGDTTDGRRFIADAVTRGAVAVVYESKGHAWTLDTALPHRAVLGLREIAGPLAAAFYAHPADSLTSIAVTGTNGKTTCAYWCALGMQALGLRAALVGTLGAGLVDDALTATGYTTPDAVQLQQRLAELRDQGANALAIEASSIGLIERRMAGMRLDVAVFTNLTRDHLDFHGSMEAYEDAKAALFDWPGLRGAVVNVDDPAGQRYWLRIHQRPDVRALHCIAYSIAGAPGANLCAENIVTEGAGTRFDVVYGDLRRTVVIATIGDYNVANWLACLGALLVLPTRKGPTIELDQAIAALRDVHPADGRVQVFGGHGAPLVVVDYAHTPDALTKVLNALRPAARARGGRLVCVFGCGGDRDRGKRPQMAAASAALADLCVLTSDNPRTEDPEAILADMRAGLTAGGASWSDADRRRAIRRVIREADANDVILVAGKGHERTQDIAGTREPFYDPDEVQAALALREEAATC